MKKILLTMTMMMICTSIYAQYTLDVTVERKKDYSEYGAKYQPLDMSGTKTTAPDPYEISRKNREMKQGILDQWAAEDRARNEARKVVSEDVQLFNGINLANKLSTSIRAKVVTRQNGSVEITCLGIKNGQSWKPCEKEILSLQQMYKSAKSESEKSMILGLMDLGSYLLDTGNEMYIIK